MAKSKLLSTSTSRPLCLCTSQPRRPLTPLMIQVLSTSITIKLSNQLHLIQLQKLMTSHMTYTSKSTSSLTRRLELSEAASWSTKSPTHHHLPGIVRDMLIKTDTLAGKHIKTGMTLLMLSTMIAMVDDKEGGIFPITMRRMTSCYKTTTTITSCLSWT